MTDYALLITNSNIAAEYPAIPRPIIPGADEAVFLEEASGSLVASSPIHPAIQSVSHCPMASHGKQQKYVKACLSIYLSISRRLPIRESLIEIHTEPRTLV
eukprot:GHVU01133822.1.p2 GENE.GHVU01133822.1~~GHVU01133822.1.p2  ORF type:complete len:101 (-),score=6.34 GHVU01133822.1:914-1216(-)